MILRQCSYDSTLACVGALPIICSKDYITECIPQLTTKQSRAMSAFSLLVLSLAILVDCAHGHGAFSRCRLLYPRDTCYLVYRSLREALLANKTNIFEMQQAFYPMGRLTSRKQVNILYTIDLTDDAMMIPLCAGATDDKNTTSPISILAAWSNSEIFNVISPYQISELQLQIANIFYGFFVIPGSGMPASDMFGWTLKDAENNRVSLQEVNLMYINMLLNDDISCLPDERILMSVLQDITIMVSIYQQHHCYSICTCE